MHEQRIGVLCLTASFVRVLVSTYALLLHVVLVAAQVSLLLPVPGTKARKQGRQHCPVFLQVWEVLPMLLEYASTL